MSTTTMHFGPEWMRTKHQPLTRPQPPPSPPPSTSLSNSGLSSYSALVSATPPVPPENTDEAHPFRYSKEDLLRIYQEGGGRGGLGLEVERWEGVVREIGAEPVALREMTDMEKKLFAGPLNSELRRRPSQTTDYLSPLNTTSLDRPRMMHSASATANSPMRERFVGMKRRDSAGGTSDLSALTIPRKPSLSTLQTPALLSPREGSPRTRVGYGSNFVEGVLNNSDSWVARRRASEASMKAGNIPGREAQDQAPRGIREEREEEPTTFQHLNGEENSLFATSSPRLLSAEPQQYAGAPDGGDLVNESSFSRNESLTSSPYRNGRAEAAPPGLTDLTAVEWSYKDPTGQIQGPFRADLMQQWFLEGYFTKELPMKRTHIDTHWMTVEELITLATNDDIFLTPPVSNVPPGLDRANNSPLLVYPPTEQVFSEPFQPAPIRSLRTSTLESYLTGGSIASESPSSSFSTSHFGNPSPDPSFGGRENRTYFGSDINGRIAGYGSQDQATSAFASGRIGGHDFAHNLGNSSQGANYGNFSAERELNINGHGFNGSHVGQESWNGFTGPSQSSSGHYNHPQTLVNHEPVSRGFNHSAYINDNAGDFSHQLSGRPEVNPMNYNQYDYVGTPNYGNNQPQQYLSQIPDFTQHKPSSHAFGLSAPEQMASQSTQNVLSPLASVLPQSPWQVLPNPSPSQGFTIPERSHPTVSITSVSANIPSDTAPAVSLQPAVVPSSLTVGNLGQHNQQQQELAEALDIEKLSIDKADVQDISEPLSASDQSLVNATKVKVSSSKPSRRAQAPPTEFAASLESAVVPAPKSAWVKEEESKKKKGATLREIQEAEAKKLESRKVVEREKARTLIFAEAKDDVQPFTTSWGLPTSQAGSRGGVPIRETPASTSTSTTATPPVWTTTSKTPTAKKTMKEIQEEEEKRKKLVAKEVSVSSAPVKRAYAESTTKVASAPTPAVAVTNAAWTTVGPSGKSTSVVVAAPVRPPMQGSTSYSSAGAPASSRVSVPPTSTAQKAPVNSALKTRPHVKADEVSETPSHEFLKWLSDSLKGLNTSVNVEEIMSMLLSFPLDADASTLEIISDTIYANSTTLNGRRFATEFVAKRKVDASSRFKSPSGSGQATVKPVSIADVVKAAPKQAQPEWGFKVVNKKKKGGK